MRTRSAIRSVLTCLLSVIVGVTAPPLAADTNGSAAEPTLRRMARGIEKPPPRYPRIAQRRGQEGWVIVTYVVTEDGQVIDPVVEDSSGIPAFEKAALDVVKTWRYEPAQQDGVAVEQCQTRHRITFALEGGKRGARPGFVRSYKKVNASLEAGELADARQELDRLFSKKGLNLYETSRAWLLESAYAEAAGERTRMIRGLYRAAAGGDYIEPEVRAQVLSRLFALELDERDYSAALAVYEDLAALKLDGDLRARADTVVEEIREQVQSGAVIGTPATVRRHGAAADSPAFWNYAPLRRRISFAEIQGVLEDFEIRCDWTRFRDQAEVDKVWNIPDSWGRCRILVFGQDGTKFKLLELPETTAAVPAS